MVNSLGKLSKNKEGKSSLPIDAVSTLRERRFFSRFALSPRSPAQGAFFGSFAVRSFKRRDWNHNFCLARSGSDTLSILPPSGTVVRWFDVGLACHRGGQAPIQKLASISLQKESYHIYLLQRNRSRPQGSTKRSVLAVRRDFIKDGFVLTAEGRTIRLSGSRLSAITYRRQATMNKRRQWARNINRLTAMAAAGAAFVFVVAVLLGVI